MKLAIVVGQVVATVKCHSLVGDPLLLIQFLDGNGVPCDALNVATDPIGAGNGEWVLVVEGSSARLASKTAGATDLSIVGIVDEVTVKGSSLFHK